MQVGFIGLGAMGWHMAANLHRAGLLGGVWNRTPARAQAFAAEFGVPAVATPEALWDCARVVVLCVRADAEVSALSERLATAAAHGGLVVDASTVSAQTARESAQRLAAVGAGFLDAPVTGGTEGAQNARLTFMVGGAPDHVATVRPALDAMGARVVHLGPVGAGQATKAVNQVMAAGINQAVSQGLAFAAALGLPLEQVVEVVSSGAAGSWFVQHRGQTMVRGEYPLGFKVSLHHKDLRICQAMAHQLGGSLPLVDATLADYDAIVAAGYGDQDTSALYRVARGRFGGTQRSVTEPNT